VNPATTPTLHLKLTDCTRKRREEGVPDIPGARAQTTAVQLPCALLAIRARTLLVATHHIPIQNPWIQIWCSYNQADHTHSHPHSNYVLLQLFNLEITNQKHKLYSMKRIEL